MDVSGIWNDNTPATSSSNADRNELFTDLYPIRSGMVLKLKAFRTHKVTGIMLARASGAIQPRFDGKGPVTPSLAARIEAATGFPVQLLCKLQSAFDLAEVRRESQTRLTKIDRIPAFA